MSVRTGISFLACAHLLAAVLLWCAAPQDAATAPRKKVRIVAVYGPRSLAQHELGNYRVRIDRDATQPVEYYWDFGDGAGAEGVLVSYRFARPGRYQVRVTARNVYGTDTDSLIVTVLPAPPAPPAGPTDSNPADTTSPAAVSAVAADVQPRLSSPAGTRPESGWPRSGYSWIVATHLHREAAEDDVRWYRKSGFWTRLMIDQSGQGSTAYRVLVGHFPTSQSAIRDKARLPARDDRSFLLLDLASLQPAQ